MLMFKRKETKLKEKWASNAFTYSDPKDSELHYSIEQQLNMQNDSANLAMMYSEQVI